MFYLVQVISESGVKSQESRQLLVCIIESLFCTLRNCPSLLFFQFFNYFFQYVKERFAFST